MEKLKPIRPPSSRSTEHIPCFSRPTPPPSTGKVLTLFCITEKIFGKVTPSESSSCGGGNPEDEPPYVSDGGGV